MSKCNDCRCNKVCAYKEKYKELEDKVKFGIKPDGSTDIFQISIKCTEYINEYNPSITRC